MKRLLNILMFFLCVSGYSQIIEAEYFIDTDPGVGNGTSISMSGEVIDSDFTIPTTGLSEGIHKLYVRTLGTDGNWSLYANKVFYINPVQENTANITSAEYFVDTDPGVGNGTPLALTGESINQNYTIPTTGLSEGTHKLYIRVLNSEGNWSLYDQNLFYVNPSQVNASTIVSAEYFIGTDPGFGNGTVLSISGTEINQNLALTHSLTDGFHKMYVRVLNAEGMWSLYEKKLLHVYQNNTALITAAEYFFDIDPGFGNATSIDFGDVENLDQDFTVQVPTDLPEGDHYLYLRVLNTDGVWSLYSISETLTSLSVEDEIANQFKFYPNPVKDVLFLETNNQDIKDLKIIDTNGRVVLEKLPLNAKVDLSSLNSGTYLLYLTTLTGSISKKLIKL